mmetsp:Transcript_17670/g.35592  ORF Transcript_17670/g.35592 Transcript_17670/m.35592 type:complete len:294 (-) Transcript_17670:451-1332(-)
MRIVVHRRGEHCCEFVERASHVSQKRRLKEEMRGEHDVGRMRGVVERVGGNVAFLDLVQVRGKLILGNRYLVKNAHLHHQMHATHRERVAVGGLRKREDVEIPLFQLVQHGTDSRFRDGLCDPCGDDSIGHLHLGRLPPALGVQALFARNRVRPLLFTSRFALVSRPNQQPTRQTRLQIRSEPIRHLRRQMHSRGALRVGEADLIELLLCNQIHRPRQCLVVFRMDHLRPQIADDLENLLDWCGEPNHFHTAITLARALQPCHHQHHTKQAHNLEQRQKRDSSGTVEDVGGDD